MLHIVKVMRGIGSSDYQPPVVYDLQAHIAKLEQKDATTGVTGFDIEFDHMRRLDMKKLEDGAIVSNFPSTYRRGNQYKTRYSDVPATEQTRVKILLSQAQALHASDFINANWVGGAFFDAKTTFVSTQGPLPNTVSDFWFMVFQRNVRIVVMLAKLVEQGRQKCAKYWPEVGETLRFQLTAYDEQWVDVSTMSQYFLAGTKNEVIIRELMIEGSDGRNWQIKFFQYVAWPDFGIPNNASSMRVLYKTFTEFLESTCPYAQRERFPIVVHCSAGIGRTGTFCAICLVLESLRKYFANPKRRGKFKYDIFGCARKLREQRSGMIQRSCQYEFVYRCILEEAIESGLYTVDREDGDLFDDF